MFRKLVAIPDTYSAFIVSVMLYADKSSECLNKMLWLLDTSDELTSSEVLQFRQTKRITARIMRTHIYRVSVD